MQTEATSLSQEQTRSQMALLTALRRAAYYLLLTLVFSTAYTQSPLFTSNQNQYFLHGLARAGYGYLHEDWLANTLDPTPVFSFLVEITYRIFQSPAVFLLIYALLLGLYVMAVIEIAAHVFDVRRTKLRFLVFLALINLLHSAGLRFALSRLLGANFTYLFEDGVADQRLLGTVLQPSAFGVLLVVSIWMFLKSRPYLAVLLAVLAATIHPTYLLSAAALTAAYMLTIYLETREIRTPLFTGLLALALVSPILYYVYGNFGSTPPETTAQAREILVHFRIPHHALISWWFDITAVFKIILITLALLAVRRKRIFTVLLVPAVIAAGLTLLQAALQDNNLAIIFPWRISVFLVPLSTVLLTGCLVQTVFERWPERIDRCSSMLQAAALALIGLAVLVGGVRLVLDFERKGREPENALGAYVASHRQPGEVYLIPVKMQDFRLESGAPAYVDFKAIPYRDADVLEWRRRIELADSFYLQPDCSRAAAFRPEGITHIVFPAEMGDLQCDGLREVYRDPAYTLYLFE